MANTPLPTSPAPPGTRPGLVVKQLALLLFLGVLLGTVYYFRVSSTPNDSGDDPPFDTRAALDRYDFFLTDVARQSGIDFVHQAPTKLDAKLQHILPIIASMGASVTVVDFNKDGLPDLFVVNSGEGSRNRLYQNMGDGTFRDVAAEMGLADLNQEGTGVCMGAVWGDFDNDGYEDVLVYKWGRPELFHNDRGKRFVRVTEKAGLPRWVNANSAVWLDFDRDGKLDLLIAGYWCEDLDLWHLTSTTIMPTSFEYAKNGGRKYLLRNRGDGTFEDVTEKMGITSTRWTLAVAAADLCGTGFPDLFFANDYGVSELYANQNGNGFKEIGESSRVGSSPKSGMNASFGDVYNNGRLAVYVSNITEPGNLVQGNNLWVPEPGRTGNAARFMNQANALGVEQGGWSWGAQFGDLNNDGRLDLYLTNGYVSADRGQSYWYDYGKIAGANSTIIQDARLWPAMKDRTLSGYQRKCVWLNKGGKFVDVAPAVNVRDRYDGRAVALADLWNRGVLDVVVANQKGPLLLYKNTVVKDNLWVQFELDGTQSNRSAIGAAVELYWSSQGQSLRQKQVISGGNGYASQNMRRLHFGLGRDARIEKAVIHWPSGKEQTVQSPAVNLLHKVKEL